MLGAVRKQSFTVEPSGALAVRSVTQSIATIIVQCTDKSMVTDIKLLEYDGKHAYKFQVGERQLALDTTSAAGGFNQRALEILMQGKPLVTRKGKQSKKPRV